MTRRAKSKLLTVSGLGPVKKESVGQQVVGQIVELIRTGNLRPGDRLPSERELVEIFGISRPSLRESMRALSVLGIIESRHGGGAFVTELDASTMLAPLDLFLALSKANFDDAFESRRIIEIEIVRKAAMKATRADIQDLNDMIAAHAKIQNDPVGFRILDSRFHEKLSAIAGNAVLRRVAYGLYNMGLDFRRRATRGTGPDRAKHPGPHPDRRCDRGAGARSRRGRDDPTHRPYRREHQARHGVGGRRKIRDQAQRAVARHRQTSVGRRPLLRDRRRASTRRNDFVSALHLVGSARPWRHCRDAGAWRPSPAAG